MHYDEEFIERVAAVIGFEHALNLAIESNTKHLGGTQEFENAVKQAMKMKDQYKDRWKKLLMNTALPQDQFEKRCLQEIFPQQFGIPDAP